MAGLRIWFSYSTLKVLAHTINETEISFATCANSNVYATEISKPIRSQNVGVKQGSELDLQGETPEPGGRGQRLPERKAT